MSRTLADSLPRLLKTQELRVFITVVETRSITETARQLSLTQPAISKSIRGLEGILGVPLFDRDNRGMQPTRYAQLLYRRAQAIFGEIRLAGEEITQLAVCGSGSVAIGTMPVAAAGLLALAVVDLALAHPETNISIMEGDYNILVDALYNRQIDLAIGRLPANPDSEIFETDPLYFDQLCVAAHHSHPLAQRRSVTLEEVVQEHCILPKEESLAYQQLERALSNKGISLPQHRIDTLSILSVDALLSTGKFIVVGLPNKVVEYRPASGLVVLPVELDTNPRPVGIIWLKAYGQLPSTKYLVKCLHKHCDLGPQPI